MNKKNLIIIAFAMIISLSQSCAKGPNTIKGNKNIVSREVNIRDYDEIRISVPVDFEYTQSSSPYLQVTTDENILERLDIYVEGHTLYVKARRRSGNREYNLQPTTLRITGSSSGLKDLKTAGSATFRTMNHIQGSSLECDLSGSGSIFFNDTVTVNKLSAEISGSGKLYSYKTVFAENADLELSGSGSISLTGNINYGEIQIAGSGSIEALGTTFQNLSCEISGSGNISATVTERLSYSISGSGKISYRGNPALSGHISGSGEIIHLD